MTLDFQNIHSQIRQLGESAPERARHLRTLREKAQAILNAQGDNLEELRRKVLRAAQGAPTLRCARPEAEPLTAAIPLPELKKGSVLLAVDGSQIAPDRHLAVDYYLINVGAIKMHIGSTEAPVASTRSQLYYGKDLYTATGVISEGQVTLKRDLEERKVLAEIAIQLEEGAVTLTDGPLELWGAKEGDLAGGLTFRQSLQAYKESLIQLCRVGAVTAGYVDKPRADLVVRLLEIAALADEQEAQLARIGAFRGVSDIELFQPRLQPGERSAVFGLQSQSVEDYTAELALHFFYLNVGRNERSWLARVEIPAWVAHDAEKLDNLHAVLVQQCQALGTRPYPYLLHRAHEAAVVTHDERQQLSQMIALELQRRGVTPGEQSHKQALKDTAGRTRYIS